MVSGRLADCQHILKMLACYVEGESATCIIRRLADVFPTFYGTSAMDCQVLIAIMEGNFPNSCLKSSVTVVNKLPQIVLVPNSRPKLEPR